MRPAGAALLLIAVLPPPVPAAAPHWPRIGIHDGSNRIVWSKGCCDGDLVIIDFRDEQGDGNQGSGLLRLSNHSTGAVLTYEIAPFWGLWKTFGPFCALVWPTLKAAARPPTGPEQLLRRA